VKNFRKPSMFDYDDILSIDSGHHVAAAPAAASVHNLAHKDTFAEQSRCELHLDQTITKSI
jgi:hypothetical protein